MTIKLHHPLQSIYRIGWQFDLGNTQLFRSVIDSVCKEVILACRGIYQHCLRLYKLVYMSQGGSSAEAHSEIGGVGSIIWSSIMPEDIAVSVTNAIHLLEVLNSDLLSSHYCKMDPVPILLRHVTSKRNHT